MKKRVAGATFTLFVANAISAVLLAQSPQGQPSVPEVLKAIDQVIEKNRELERQNQDLMTQIRELRQALAAQAGVAHGASAQTSAGQQTAAGDESAPKLANQHAAGSSASDGEDEAKSLLPQASDGAPGVFGEFNPGKGFTVAKAPYGILNLSGYMAARYLNQLPADQTATDHLGRPIAVTPRQDFHFHRVMLFTQGWLFTPKLQYGTFLWTVQDTDQVAVGGALSYQFNKYALVGIGWNAYPGTQSLQGSHPYWQSYDRVMADEFFRPFFSQGVYGQGIIFPRLEYRWMVGNNNSNLDVAATKLDRKLSAGAALTWLPTTGEFGPRGAFGDYESHEKLATRFNFAYTYSPEDRQSDLNTAPGNTTLRLADSLNVFDADAFGNGITVEKVTYKLFTTSAAMKYRGFWLQGEGYYRRLDNFVASGRMPVSVVRDTGFYAQLAYMIVPRKSSSMVRLLMYSANMAIPRNSSRVATIIPGTLGIFGSILS